MMNRKLRSILSLLLAVILLSGLTEPALAAETIAKPSSMLQKGIPRPFTPTAAPYGGSKAAM